MPGLFSRVVRPVKKMVMVIKKGVARQVSANRAKTQHLQGKDSG
jgi:hypothetical protein